MRSWIGIGLLVVAALMGVFLLVTEAEPIVYRAPVAGETSEPAPLTSDADQTAPPREELAPPPEETAEVATDTPGDPERMWGRVIDGITRAPIARAEVKLLHRDADEFWSLDLEAGERIDELAQTTTDENGGFAFAVERGRMHRLAVHAAGYADRTELHCSGGAAITIELTQGATIEGIVREADGGDPVAGIEIRVAVAGEQLELGRTTTDRNGAFRLVGLPPHQVYVQANPPAHQPVWKIMELAPATTHQVEIELAAGRRVHGRVLDAITREPVARAEVSDSWVFRRSAHTAADGSFVLPGLREDHYAEVHVRARGYANASPNLPTDPSEPLEVLLVRGGAVTGRLVTIDGSVPSAAYAAAGASWMPNPGVGNTDWLRAAISATGEFVVEGLNPLHHYWLYVRAAGCGTRVMALPQPVRDGERLDVGEVVLRGAAGIEGRLRNEDGSPIGGVEIDIRSTTNDALAWLQSPEPPRVTQFESRTTVTGSDGRFRITGLAGGSHRLSYEDTKVEVSVDDGEVLEGIELVVERGLEISGKVRRSDGQPLGESVFLMLNGVDGDAQSTWTDSDGSFRAAGLDAGSYTIQVVHCEQGWVAPPVRGIAAGTVDVTVLLQPSAQLSGRVLGVDGEPVSVSVFATFDPPIPNGIFPSTTSETDGTFALDVPVDFYGSIYAQENPAIKATIDGVTAGQADLTLRLQTSGIPRKR